MVLILAKMNLYPELKYYEVKVDTAVTDFSAFAGNSEQTINC